MERSKPNCLIAISTLVLDLEKLEEVVGSVERDFYCFRDDFDFLIVMQGDPLLFDLFSKKVSAAVKIIFLDNRGLSVSRNKAIQYACAENYEWLIFSDDDIAHMDPIRAVKHQLSDLVLMRSSFPDGTQWKSYPEKFSFRHVTRFASFEIAVRCAFVEKYNLLFDERFGLGAKIGSGEENIFISSILKRGGNVSLFPQVCCIHPWNDFNKYTRGNVIFQKFFVLKEIFGLGIAIVAFPLFFLKKRFLGRL